MWKKLLTFALIANIVLTAGCVTAADKKAPSAEEADTYEMLNLFGESWNGPKRLTWKR